MQKIISKKLYDTESAILIKKYTVGKFGDPTGFEETLYQMPDGYYFIYTNGGMESPYSIEKISRIAKAKVKDWLEKH